MKIGELAKQAQCSIQTIRFYERKGLLEKPERSEGNYRLYDNAAVNKLVFIRQCRALGIQTKEIGILLAQKATPEQSCANVDKLIAQHLTQVDKKIAELLQLKTTLAAMTEKCASNTTIQECGILNALDGQ